MRAYLPLVAALVALLFGLAIGKAWERYKLSGGRWIDRRRARESPHYILGLNFLVSNQIDLAIEELNKAASLDRDALEVHMILGNLYREKGQVGKAITVHQTLLQRPRLTKLEQELGNLKEQATELETRWQNELNELNRVGQIQEKLDQARTALEQASLRADWEQAARLNYEVSQLEQQRTEAEHSLNERGKDGRTLVKEEVDEQDIADVVSRWTGIPVSKLIEGEVEKLIHMEIGRAHV